MLGHNASWYAVKGDHLEVKVIIDQAPSIATWDIGIACIFLGFSWIYSVVILKNDLCLEEVRSSDFCIDCVLSQCSLYYVLTSAKQPSKRSSSDESHKHADQVRYSLTLFEVITTSAKYCLTFSKLTTKTRLLYKKTKSKICLDP